ncbi:MAG: hypothetical protein ACOC38_02985 [Promethearchaeia archaeon]
MKPEKQKEQRGLNGLKVVVVGKTHRELVDISNLLKTEVSNHEKEDSASQWIGQISKARILDDTDPDFERKLADAYPNVVIIVLDSEKEYAMKSKQLVKNIRNKIPGVIVVGLVNQVEGDDSLAIDRIESLLGVTCYEFPSPED